MRRNKARTMVVLDGDLVVGLEAALLARELEARGCELAVEDGRVFVGPRHLVTAGEMSRVIALNTDIALIIQRRDANAAGARRG